MSKVYETSSTVMIPAPAGGVVAGRFYRVGGLFGQARNTVAEGKMFVLDREGVFNVSVTNGSAAPAIATGDPVYFNNGSFNVAPAGVLAGYALEPGTAGPSVDTIDVAISPVPQTTGAEAVEDAGGADA